MTSTLQWLIADEVPSFLTNSKQFKGTTCQIYICKANIDVVLCNVEWVVNLPPQYHLEGVKRNQIKPYIV